MIATDESLELDIPNLKEVKDESEEDEEESVDESGEESIEKTNIDGETAENDEMENKSDIANEGIY